MANIINIKGGSGGSSVLITKSITENGTYNASSDNADGYSQVTVSVGGSTVGLHSGKIYDDGTISADADYVYTDEFPCPSGAFIMDYGTTANNRYVGIRMYDGGSFYEYWNATSRYRELDNTSYYRTDATARLSFPLALLSKVMVMDYDNSRMITGANVLSIVNS